jgi:uncharacterized protein (TIGR00369 family)
MKSKSGNASKRLKDLLRSKLKESHATELLGFELDTAEKGRAVLRLDVRRQHRQLHSVVHGGILAAMADTAAAIASYTVLPKGSTLATVELSINYLEPVPGGRVKAEGRVLRVGRNFVVGNAKFESRAAHSPPKRCSRLERPADIRFASNEITLRRLSRTLRHPCKHT